MNMTVEQALSVYPLSEGRLIAGRRGVNRVVKSVNVMDAPDIGEWIKEGEMLLTTAYLIKDQLQEAAHLLDKLHASGSAGLGIKLGPFWSAIPEALVDRADELGFPLIELPHRFTFSDQMNGLFLTETKNGAAVPQDALDKQIRLMRLALQAEPPGRVFEAVSAILGEPFAVVGSRGQIAYNASDIPNEDLALDQPLPPCAKWIEKPSWQAYGVPLMKQEQCTGVALFFAARTFLGAVEESLYAQASELIAHHLHYDCEDYLHKDFGRLLLRHLKHGLPIEAVNEYAARWEIDLLKQPYRLALTDLPTEPAGASRQQKLEALKRQYLEHRPLQELKGVHLALDEGVLSLYPDDAKDGGDRLLAALASCLSGKGRSPSPRVTVSSGKRKPEQLAEAFGECRETQRLALDWGLDEAYLAYETLDLAFIFESVPKEKMRRYCDRWLGGLLGKDPEYVREMMRTLEAYLDNDGQLNETAKRMFIHRNTATYRIEKLGELLNVDFKRIDVLLRLKMAFLFRRLLGRNDGAGDRI